MRLLKKWSHGPHALVATRNNLVHPDQKHDPLSETALIEAQNLGLHYIELMLLRLSGYTGRYVNRLKSGNPPSFSSRACALGTMTLAIPAEGKTGTDAAGERDDYASEVSGGLQLASDGWPMEF